MSSPTAIPSTVPLNPPPPGVVSNFDNPDASHYHQFLATVITCTTLSFIAVVVRIYARLCVVRSFGWDDGLCVVAWALSVAYLTSTSQELLYGLGYEDWDLREVDFYQYDADGWYYWNSVSYLVYIFAFAFIKFSILALYLRILGKTHKMLQISVYAVMAIVAGVWISGISLLLSFCSPVTSLFYDVPGVCGAYPLQFFAQSIMQIITDFLVLIPPIPMVWGLNLSRSRKIGFIGVLCVGLLVTGISIRRMVYFIPGGPIVTTVTGQYPNTLWSVIEINFALIAACLPGSTQFFVKVHQVVVSSRARSSRPSDGINGPSSGNSAAKKNEKVDMRSPTSRILDDQYARIGVDEEEIGRERERERLTHKESETDVSTDSGDVKALGGVH